MSRNDGHLLDATMMSWPQPLRSYLRGAFGSPMSVERLGGMSGAGVYRVQFAETSVIVKARAGANEAWFYREAAPVLAERGVASPACHWNDTVGGDRWLVLEDIRQSLPRERWLADAAVLGMLRRLHQTPADLLLSAPAPFRPGWSSEMTAAALTLLSHDAARAVRSTLDAIRAAAQPLFAPAGLISGDPNPANWGVRDTGEGVLFDWERFGFGATALDLAITVPGLGDVDAFRRVAEMYLTTVELPAIDQLARGVAHAKVWTTVEFLAGAATGVAQPPPELVNWLVGRLPAWLGEIGADKSINPR